MGQRPGRLAKDSYRAIRVPVVLALLLLSVVASLMGWFEVCDVVRAPQGITTSCRPPLLTDAGTLAVVALVVALLWPDLSELSVFGVSLKHRVEVAEERTREAVREVSRLEGLLIQQQVRVDTMTMAAATSTVDNDTNVTVNFITPEASMKLRVAGERALEAERKLDQGSESTTGGEGTGTGAPEPVQVPATETRPSSDELKEAFLRSWSTLERRLELFAYPLTGTTRRRSSGAPRSHRGIEGQDSDVIRHFKRDHMSELLLLQDVRKTIASHGAVEYEDLEAAVHLSASLVRGITTALGQRAR